MRLLLIAVIVLIPVASFARTDCHVIDQPDKVIAECVGDEKAVPVPDTRPSASEPFGEKKQHGAQEQNQSLVDSVEVPSKVTPSATAASPASKSPGPQDGLAHRQGRQQYQKTIEDARTVRDQFISDSQRGQQSR